MIQRRLLADTGAFALPDLETEAGTAGPDLFETEQTFAQLMLCGQRLQSRLGVALRREEAVKLVLPAEFQIAGKDDFRYQAVLRMFVQAYGTQLLVAAQLAIVRRQHLLDQLR